MRKRPEFGSSPEGQGDISDLERALEQDIVFKTPIPEVFQKRARELSARFDAFESLARETDDWEKDPLDIVPLLEAEGVLTPEFIKELQEAGEEVKNSFVSKINRFKKHGSQLDIVRYMHDVESEMGRGLSVLRNKRPLAFLVTNELSRFNGMMQIEEVIETHGVRGARRFLRNRDTVFYDWYLFAKKLKKERPETAEGDLSNKEIMELLNDMDFEPSGSVDIDISSLSMRGKSLSAQFSVPEHNHPLQLGRVRILDSEGKPIVHGHIARITGDIAFDGSVFLDTRRPFTSLGNEQVYDYLRTSFLRGILDGVDSKELTEKEYVDLGEFEAGDLDEEDIQEGVEQLPLEMAEEVLEVQPEESGDIIKPDEQVTDLPTEELPLPERRKRVVVRERRLSWRRIINTLARVGVEVDLSSSSHPKLKFEGRTTRFLNSHEKDMKKNKRELNRVLRELGISKDTFFEKLK